MNDTATEMVICPRCNGEGETYDPWLPQYEHADGSERAPEPCDLCSGYGEVTPGVKRWYKRKGGPCRG